LKYGAPQAQPHYYLFKLSMIHDRIGFLNFFREIFHFLMPKNYILIIGINPKIMIRKCSFISAMRANSKITSHTLDCNDLLDHYSNGRVFSLISFGLQNKNLIENIHKCCEKFQKGYRMEKSVQTQHWKIFSLCIRT
jgi:hypothetical protein